jgi:hypothetical protein
LSFFSSRRTEGGSSYSSFIEKRYSEYKTASNSALQQHQEKKKEKVTPVSVIDSDEETAEFVDPDETVDVEEDTVPLYDDEFPTKDVEGPEIIHMDPN